ncbi:tRNA-queuosine alpha-mannosyltransferase domain-containing protein [Halomonas faecis]|uniref:tRNA-queuosine alpha-mannosyltransferase domain-containing protein n=1 Tax=Halomonas faecis TaxID=1562110 RepID=UPI0013D3C802|nr:DUF3524 domain-containing protein [Halomonas faecis]
MRALLLSAYAAVSHRHWAQGMVEWLDDCEWTLLELPPRHFRWRIRGNPLTWMLRDHETLARHYDVVLATSMVDLATLCGLYPHLGQAHKVVYFHENQFAYPLSPHQAPQPEALMVNLYAALAADRLVFNTAYNRDSFVAGARRFLNRMPENLPAARPLAKLAEAAEVLPVPISPLRRTPPARAPGRRIIWNHRWEYDKNPEDFFAVLFSLAERGSDFEVAVMGQQFRDCPAIFDEARRRLGARVVCWGPQPEGTYREELASGDIVVSTTWHEFQGLSVMEAAQLGVLPLVPDRLCFPELYGPEYRYDGTREGLESTLEAWLTAPERRPPPPDVSAWEWPVLAARYRALLSGG